MVPVTLAIKGYKIIKISHEIAYFFGNSERMKSKFSAITSNVENQFAHNLNKKRKFLFGFSSTRIYYKYLCVIAKNARLGLPNARKYEKHHFF